MRMIKRAPKWVRKIPVPIHKRALLALAKASEGAFDKPREMNYVLTELTPGKQKELISELQNTGWHCSVDSQEGAPDFLVLTATQQNYRITEERYTHDLQFFRGLEDRFGVNYDGWYASN